MTALAPSVARAGNGVQCTDLPNVLIGAGGSASRPLLATVGAALVDIEDPITLVYQSPGACFGITAYVDDSPITGTASYWDTDGNELTRTLPLIGVSPDFGMLGVQATLCEGVDEIPDGLGEATGPITSWSLIASNESSQTSISAEAVYFAYGFGAAPGQVDPWVVDAELYSRNANAAALIAIARAAGIPPNSFKGIDVVTNQAMITSVAASQAPGAGLGYTSTEVADLNRDVVHTLAFQAFDQTCGYWPDSTATAFDKRNVRDGHYYLWSPYRFHAPADGAGVFENPVAEPLYRLVGVHNGPTIKPLVSKLGLVDGSLLPDLADEAGELLSKMTSREVEATLLRQGFRPPSRTTLANRLGEMLADISTGAREFEDECRVEEKLDSELGAISCGLDRVAARMDETLPEGLERTEKLRQRRSPEKYQRTPPEPHESTWRMAWAANVTLYDTEGRARHSFRHGADAGHDVELLVARVVDDVYHLCEQHAGVPVACIQDGGADLEPLRRRLRERLSEATEIFDDNIDASKRGARRGAGAWAARHRRAREPLVGPRRLPALSTLGRRARREPRRA